MQTKVTYNKYYYTSPFHFVSSSSTYQPQNPSTMPSQMAKFCKEKAVLVSVYVERPRRPRRVSSSNNRRDHHHQVHLHHHHHHHHFVHHRIRQEVSLNRSDDAGKGYNRRAELLLYSQRLRESARSAESSPLVQKPVSSSNNQLHSHSIRDIVAVRKKPKYSSTPACLGKLIFLLPNVLGSFTSHLAKKDRRKKKKKKKKQTGFSSNSMKAVAKSLQMPKKKGFLSKFFSSCKRHS